MLGCGSLWGHHMRRIVVAAILSALLIGTSAAAEVRIYASIGLKKLVEDLARKSEAETGHKVSGEYAVVAKLKRQIDAGEAFDVAILTPEAIAALVSDRKVENPAGFARAGMGIGIRKGAPRPDVSTPEAVKQTLLNAKSVSYSTEGMSGRAYLAIVARLGIAEQMKDKARGLDTGVVGLVASGQIEMTVTSVSSILLSRRRRSCRAFPPELQQYVLFDAALS